MEEDQQNSSVDKSRDIPQSSCTFSVMFLGSMSMHRLYSQTMQPWVMAEIHRKKSNIKDVVLEIVEDTIHVSSKDSTCSEEKLLFEHHLKVVTRFAKLHQDPKCFGYLTRQQLGADFLCHVYLANSEEVVPQIFQALRGATKGIITRSVSEETNTQSSVEDGRQVTDGEDAGYSKSLFEVKYIGKAKVDSKKVTSDDVDILAEKMMTRLHEQEKTEEELNVRRASEASIQSLQDTQTNVAEDLTKDNMKDMSKEEQLETSQSKSGRDAFPAPAVTEDVCNNGLVEATDSKHQPEQSVLAYNDLNPNSGSRKGSSLEKSLSCHDAGHPQTQPALWSSSSAGDVSRRRHSSQIEDANETEERLSFLEPSGSSQFQDSTDSQDTFGGGHKKHQAGQVMVLQIGQQKITLISLDQKMANLECKFKDISSVSQGSHKQDLFGIVARESDSSLICYILRCFSGGMVVDIMSTLQVAFASAYKERGTTTTTSPATTTQNQVCTTCPLYQLHRICQEINTMSSQAAYELLVKKIQLLPDRELNELNSHMQVEQPESIEDSVEVMMIFLRMMCETKQKEHVHISDNKSCRTGTSSLEDKQNLFDGLKVKARRSFTTSFENLLSRGKRKEGGGSRHVSWTTDSDTSSWTSGDSSSTSTPDTSPMCKEFRHRFPSPPSSPGPARQRSATLDSGSIPHSDLQRARRRDVNHNKASSPGRSVILPAGNSFHRFGSLRSYTGTSPQKDTVLFGSHKHPNSSWRKAIFNRVCTPQHSGDYDDDQTLSKLHNREEIRAIWKKAILETLLLIRLEKENHNIQARQEEGETTLSRKLDYQELTPCLKEITSIWKKMLVSENRVAGEVGVTELSKVKLGEYVKKGVPRSLRGQIWLFLMRQQQKAGAVPDSSCDDSVSYEELLKQLTTHQHAILIDLGRTFPNHPYFSTSLGPGQLELFNLLKAYSLLDAEVGYCQGLSFIVGMLLMHMEETSAFQVLKYIMYDLGLRKQFRPNMMALQVKLYQLTRLLHDHYKDVYDHLEHHEISPSLYAAPWFLTLFASQFPLGFVARVFDMIFVQGIGALLKVALMLIGNHRALILQCDSFETVVDFLKITLPEMVQVQMERIINQAFELDIDRQLQAYEVEYHVLSEEMTFSAPKQQQQQQHMHASSQHGKVQPPSASEIPYRKVDRRRMSIDLEMLYRLENQNRALKNQNMELLEKLQQAQCLRESCEHSVLAYQVERDKLKSHIQVLELERAALLTAVANLQTLVPQDSLQNLSLSFPPAIAASPSHPDLIKESAEAQLDGKKEVDHNQTVEEAHPVTTANLGTRTSYEPQEQIQMASSNDTPPGDSPGGSPITQLAMVPLTDSLKKELPSEALNFSIAGIRSPQIIHPTSSGQSDLITLHSILDNVDSEPVTGLTPSPALIPSRAAPSGASLDKSKSENLTTPMSPADLHTSTTVSSSRQLYSSRSISNVPSNLPAVGSVTPEERRRSVKVVVQHSNATTNLHQNPNSQR